MQPVFIKRSTRPCVGKASFIHVGGCQILWCLNVLICIIIVLISSLGILSGRTGYFCSDTGPAMKGKITPIVSNI